MHEAYTLRGVERAFGISRARLSEAVRTGALPAARLGSRRMTILRGDVLRYIKKHSIRPGDFAEARVDEVLERDRRTVG
jgi:hypothetical protein